jgi:hypothetical protein
MCFGDWYCDPTWNFLTRSSLRQFEEIRYRRIYLTVVKGRKSSRRWSVSEASLLIALDTLRHPIL